MLVEQLLLLVVVDEAGDTLVDTVADGVSGDAPSMLSRWTAVASSDCVAMFRPILLQLFESMAAKSFESVLVENTQIDCH